MSYPSLSSSTQTSRSSAQGLSALTRKQLYNNLATEHDLSEIAHAAVLSLVHVSLVLKHLKWSIKTFLSSMHMVEYKQISIRSELQDTVT